MEPNSIAAIGQNQFLQLLVAQLQNQDPLDPVSDQEFISQLATFSTLQSQQELNASFAEQLKLQQLTEGANLIGRTIEFRTTDAVGNSVGATGTVDAVQVADGAFVLGIGQNQIGLDDVISVLS